MEHDSTVLALFEFVIELEFKPVVLVIRNDVARITRVYGLENAILNFPTRMDPGFLEVVPPVGGLSVEEELPALMNFPRSQGVVGSWGMK